MTKYRYRTADGRPTLRFWIEDLWPWALGAAVIIAILYWIVSSLIADNARYNRLMAECMQERKEYECVSMLKTDTQVVPVPIMVPVR